MNKKTFWVGTSWKMNKTLSEAKVFCDALAAAKNLTEGKIQPFIIPPFTVVREVKSWLDATDVLVGAQNMHWAEAGAWTGEISAPMLVDCKLDLVELGHSERREFFGETNKTVGLKVQAAVKHGLTPLICIGETALEKENGKADEILTEQVEAALSGISHSDSLVLLAYEPVWAIGEHGTPATADYVQARHALISKVASDCLARSVPCLYGGSVNPGNAAELSRTPHVDGLFIGRSAWNSEGYLDIIQRVKKERM